MITPYAMFYLPLHDRAGIMLFSQEATQIYHNCLFWFTKTNPSTAKLSWQGAFTIFDFPTHAFQFWYHMYSKQ